MRTYLFTFLMAMTLAGTALADSFDDAVAAYKSGDYATAARRFRPLANEGDARAQFNLGLFYEKGQGVPQDNAEAVKWYRKAADQGDAFAQFNLGFVYSAGQGIPQDYVQAYKWYNLAATRLSAAGATVRDKAIKSRDLIAAKMTPQQIAKAQKLAREWKPK